MYQTKVFWGLGEKEIYKAFQIDGAGEAGVIFRSARPLQLFINK